MIIQNRITGGLTNKQRVLVLLLVIATVGFTAAGLSLWSLYGTALAEERARMIEIVQSQARLIEAVARFDAANSQDENPHSAAAATLSQVIDAHTHYQGFGETGEFTLARREGDEIVFLLSFRHEDPRIQKRLPFRGKRAEPMRRALDGMSGSLVGLDYRGVKVVAAHEPLAALNAGIVAKIDLAEFRSPFINAGVLSLGGAIVIVTLGMALFHHFSSPLVARLEYRVKERTRELSQLNENLRQEVGERRQAQEALTRSLLDQEIIASILKLALLPIPLDEILRQSLVLVLHKHGFGLSPQGCVFLVHQNGEELLMVVRHGLPESIVTSCGRLPFGSCLCGIAAQSGKVVHSGTIDGRHEHTYAGIEPHGHYCVPIRDESGVLGVLNLYLPPGHQRSHDEEQFVLAIAHTMAGVIRRKQAAEALLKSEANLVEAQRIAHLGSWDWDIVRDDLSWSDETYRIFGVSPTQFETNYESFMNLVHPSDREIVKKAVKGALKEKQLYSIEHRIIRPDGVERSVHEKAQIIYDADRSPVRMVGTVQDVTEHKQVKMARRRLKEELEKKERERLATILHDGVGQNLQAVNLGLRMLVENMTEPVSAEILPELVEEVRKTIDQVRDLTEELSPVHLEHMDLAEAIRSHASKLTARAKAEITVNTNGAVYDFLSDRIKEHCFLIFQEALTNAIKHSDAENVAVQLSLLDDNRILMKIIDDGRGFSTSQTMGQEKGLGLSIIRERAVRLGGSANIFSEPENGTTVTIKIPIS